MRTFNIGTGRVPERAGREDTVRLWQKVRTVEDPEWTQRYHDPDPDKKAFGAKIEITFKNGEKLIDEMARANAHPAGARPFERANYIGKFDAITEGIIEKSERDRFIQLVERLPELSAEEVLQLNVQVSMDQLECNTRDDRGIF